MDAMGDSTGKHFPPGQSSPFLWGRRGLPRWLTGKEFAYNAGNTGSVPGPGRSPGEGNGNPLQYSQLENPMHREAWWVIVHWVTRVGHNLATKQQQKHRVEDERVGSPVIETRVHIQAVPFKGICHSKPQVGAAEHTPHRKNT